MRHGARNGTDESQSRAQTSGDVRGARKVFARVRRLRARPANRSQGPVPRSSEIESMSSVGMIRRRTKITRVKLRARVRLTESLDTTVDEVLFDIMNKKYVIANKISDLIKEASVDCLQNTRDDYNIHQSCVQFDKKIQDENAFFPGMDSDDLYITDQRQLISKKPASFIEPDIYVLPAL